MHRALLEKKTNLPTDIEFNLLTNNLGLMLQTKINTFWSTDPDTQTRQL